MDTLEGPIEWTNARESSVPIIGRRREPKVDILISKAVGKTILLGNPIVLRVIAEWKRATNKTEDSKVADNLLDNQVFIDKLKKALY